MEKIKIGEKYNTQKFIVDECDLIKNVLLQKNMEYGDSAINPKRIFSTADNVEQINVRIDDKLSRLMTPSAKVIKEDTELDLIGYLILRRVAKKYNQQTKTLCAGERGKGNVMQDLTECRDAIDRAILLQEGRENNDEKNDQPEMTDIESLWPDNTGKMTIADWCRVVHENAVNHGWWEEKRAVPEILCLIHSEISEALEAYRNRDDENFAEEMADVAIRLFDACESYDIDLESEIEKKHKKNITREYRHGGKRC